MQSFQKRKVASIRNTLKSFLSLDCLHTKSQQARILSLLLLTKSQIIVFLLTSEEVYGNFRENSVIVQMDILLKGTSRAENFYVHICPRNKKGRSHLNALYFSGNRIRFGTGYCTVQNCVLTSKLIGRWYIDLCTMLFLKKKKNSCNSPEDTLDLEHS